MDYKIIKTHVDMNRLLDQLNIERDKSGRCTCPLHGGDNKTAFAVHSDGQGWTCHTKCETSGDIFTFIEKYESCTNAQARVRIMELFNLVDDKPVSKVQPKPKPQRVITSRKEYVYHDESGEPLYNVNRVDYSDGKKDCFMSYKGKPHLPPSVRTLYNLHRIKSNTEDFIILCEGEKTADAVTECSYIGTTNPLGSKNWEPEYAELLKDQKVVIMPDADEHGEKWRDEVIDSLRGKVDQIQVVNIPSDFVRDNPQYSGHDFADFLKENGKDKGIEFLMDSIEASVVMPRGVDAEILGRPCDIIRDVERRAKLGHSTTVFNMNEWLPSMDLKVHQGDLIVLMGNTSTGKTRVLHNLPFHIRRLNYACFDLELSKDTLAMRYLAMQNKLNMNNAEFKIQNGMQLKMLDDIDHVFIQKIGGLTVEKIKDRVDLLEKVSGRRMHVVAVDYIGLMSGNGSSYESTTSNVEAFKAYVSHENRVGVLTTQVTRPGDREEGMWQCPSPFSAKNSGSVENSSQILLGFWKDQYLPERMHVRCMKYTHGSSPERDIPLDAFDLLIREAVFDG